MNKKCMKCGKPATHKFVRIEGSQVHDLYYCRAHASQASVYQKPKNSLSEILSEFLSQEQAAQVDRSTDLSPMCASCSLHFAVYRKTLFLGCPKCYDSFHALLIPELQKFHGATTHVGRKPGGGAQDPTEHKPKIPEVKSPLLLAPPSGEGDEGGAMAEVKSDPKPKSPPKPKTLAELNKAMEDAIEAEDFEKAAQCRDEMRKLKEARAAEPDETT